MSKGFKKKFKKNWRAEAGRKGGRSRSAKKMAAMRKTLPRAWKAAEVARRVEAVEDLIVANREAWLRERDVVARAVLDAEFEQLIRRKGRLMGVRQ